MRIKQNIFLLLLMIVATISAIFVAGDNGPPPPACIPVSPTVDITPSNQTGNVTATLPYTVTVTNNDPTDCPASVFSLYLTPPPELFGSFATNSLQISPGQQASTTVHVTSFPNTMPGQYIFAVFAIHSEVGFDLGVYVVA